MDKTFRNIIKELVEDLRKLLADALISIQVLFTRLYVSCMGTKHSELRYPSKILLLFRLPLDSHIKLQYYSLDSIFSSNSKINSNRNYLSLKHISDLPPQRVLHIFRRIHICIMETFCSLL